MALWQMRCRKLAVCLRTLRLFVANSGRSVAALTVDGVVQVAHHGDPCDGEGLRGDLLVAHHAQTVPRPSRSRQRPVALAALAAAAAAGAAHSGADFPNLADGEVGEGGAERGAVGGVEEGVDGGVAPS